MDLALLCPCSVASVVWQPQADAWNISICVKATFALVHGAEARLADVQEPAVGDAYHEEDRYGTPRVSSDFSPYKPRAEVVFVGGAHAPAGVAVESLVARISVGEFSKALRVVGDRAWVRGANGAAPGAPAPFRAIPMRYERAARRGDNLSDVAASDNADVGRPLPNIDVETRDPDDAATPGLGPLPAQWRARRAQLDEAAILWAYRMHARAPESPQPVVGPPPSSFDFGFFNAAPEDQQVDVLEPGMRVVLEHLDARHERFEAKLPKARPRLFRAEVDDLGAAGRTDAAPAPPVEVALRCDTLWMDGDRGIACVSWRGLVDIASADEADFGRFAVAWETAGEPFHMGEVLEALGAADGGPPSAPSAPPPPVPTPPPPPSVPAARVSQPDIGATTGSNIQLPPPPPPRSKPLGGLAAGSGLGLGVAPGAPVSDLSDEDLLDDDGEAVTRHPILERARAAAAEAGGEAPRGRGRIETMPPPADAPAELDDTPAPETPPPSALPFVANKLGESALPFRPAPSSAPSARADSVPSKKLDGLPFKPTEEAEAGRFSALPFKPSAGGRLAPRVAALDNALPFSKATGTNDTLRSAAHVESPRASSPDLAALVDDPSTARDMDAEPTSIDPPKAFPQVPGRVVKPLGGMRLGGGLGAAPGASAQLGRTALGDSIDDEVPLKLDAPIVSAPKPPRDEALEDQTRPLVLPKEGFGPQFDWRGSLVGAAPPNAGVLPPAPAPPALLEVPRPAVAAPAVFEPVKRPELLGEKLFELPQKKAPEAAAPASAEVAPAPPAPASPPAEGAPFDPASFPVEVCAAVQAELALKKTPMSEVLKKSHVSTDDWGAVERHWLAAITKETERGKTALLGAYDAAYVGALEKLRGPIATEDYARIVVGVEGGEIGAVLAQMGLPRTALMRIERVWTKRLAEDSALAQAVNAAVEGARKG